VNVAEGLLGQDIAANARCFGTAAADTDAALRWRLARARHPHLPDSSSISYGECERMIRGAGSRRTTRADANPVGALFVQLGLASVGTYPASGDFGSACNGLPYAVIAWPAPSPYVAAVGGTRVTLNRANQRTNEVVWNDTLWTQASMGGGASGGGFPIASPRPRDRNGLGLPGHARATPDVSASAPNFPGWPVELGRTWTIDGGTTGSAPLVTAAMAVPSADQQRHHRPPIGPANGLFSHLATHAPPTSVCPSSWRWRRPSWRRAAARVRRRPTSPGARRERRRPVLDARVKRLAAADDGVVASPRPMISRVG